MAGHFLELELAFRRGEPINHKDLIAAVAKERASGRNMAAWIATRATNTALRNREEEYEGSFWPSHSVASDLLGAAQERGR